MMNLASIEHHAFDNYCYPLDKDILEINLRTGKDVEKVQLVWGDPFDWETEGNAGVFCWRYATSDFTGKRELQNHFWWTVHVKPAAKRCKYFIRLCTGKEAYIYGESGICTEEDFKKNSDGYSAFIFSWMNESDICNPPDWAKDAVWYQIFPSRFCRGPIEKETHELEPWAAPDQKVTNRQHFGGNLAGITGRLDHLKSLGITGIYLNPINESTTEHKYDTTDYYEIDPEFGTKEDMKTLVRTAHQKGIRIMMDGVFNHSGWEFFAWQDVLKNRQKSKYATWYMVNNWDFTGEPSDNARKNNFFSFAYCDYMPKFNTNNSEVRKYLIDVCEYWVREYDIDALRLDVSDEVSHTFCRELQERMKSLKSDFYIIGEIWHNSTPWLRGNEFDAVMNYPLQNAIYSFALDKKKNTRDFEQSVNRCMTEYFAQTVKVMFNLMDSHDTMRLATKAGSREKALQLLAVMLAMPGSPCVYYGTEVMLEGGKDPDCRRCMPWKEIERGDYDSTIASVRRLIFISKNYPEMRTMEMQFVHDEGQPRLLWLKKGTGGEGGSLDVLANLTDRPLELGGIMEGKEVLFENLLDGSVLREDGVAILHG